MRKENAKELAALNEKLVKSAELLSTERECHKTTEVELTGRITKLTSSIELYKETVKDFEQVNSTEYVNELEDKVSQLINRLEHQKEDTRHTVDLLTRENKRLAAEKDDQRHLWLKEKAALKEEAQISQRRVDETERKYSSLLDRHIILSESQTANGPAPSAHNSKAGCVSSEQDLHLLLEQQVLTSLLSFLIPFRVLFLHQTFKHTNCAALCRTHNPLADFRSQLTRH